jgi:hypothetical protein
MHDKVFTSCIQSSSTLQSRQGNHNGLTVAPLEWIIHGSLQRVTSLPRIGSPYKISQPGMRPLRQSYIIQQIRIC